MQGGAYRGDRADPARRVTTDRLGLNSDCRFALAVFIISAFLLQLLRSLALRT